MRERFDYIIVGAGLAGTVVAERLSAAGHTCLVLEKRNHVGGNCHDRPDKNGLLYHAYGPHYFRTNSAEVRGYLSKFTKWREVTYRVAVNTHGRQWSFPINLGTFRQLSGSSSATEAEFVAYLNKNRLNIVEPQNSEEAMLSSIGSELYELFFRGYTQKQWGRPAASLEPSVCRRIPVRTNLDDRYFQEDFQALPVAGYTAMFENMMASCPAEFRFGIDYRDILPLLRFDHLIYTGPIDEYFNFRWGRLPYRTLRFSLEELSNLDQNSSFAQSVLQINYPGDELYTRTVELKHITGQQSLHTNIVREFPAEYRPGTSEPYYPIPGPESQALAEKYRALAAAERDTSFLGRLATYRYLNMDQVVAAALHTADKLLARRSGANASKARLRSRLSTEAVG